MNLKLRDLNGSLHLKTRDNCFILGLIIGGTESESVGLLDYESFGLVRTIPILAPLPFDVPSTFKTHPFKRLLCDGGTSVNSAMKSAKTCPLIAILSSNVTPRV